MKLATTTGDFKNYAATPAGIVRLFEGTGFRHLDYNFYSVIYEGSPFLGDHWLEEVEAAGREAERLGMRFAQAHSPDYNPMNPRADHETGMKATLRSIEACGRLGIPYIVVHSGSCDLPYPEGREEYFRINRDYYRSLLPALEKAGVCALVENGAEANSGGHYCFMTGGEMRGFIEYVGHPLLQGCWDVGHSNLRDSDVYRDLVDVGTHLRALHIQDNGGGSDEHMAPFMGTVDLDAVMQALLKIGYKGCFTFEATNTLLAYCTWPHRRKQSPSVTERRLVVPPLSLRRDAEKLLYSIGRHILAAYDCLEE